MELLGLPIGSKNTSSKNQSPIKQGNISNIFSQQWKSQQDYKREIISLELQNQKYRNQLYELGETVNKILEKVKAPIKSNGYTPNLSQQLQLVKKQFHNVNQFIQIYQKQLSGLNNKKKKDQVQNLANTEDIFKSKTEELAVLKKQVKQLSHKNKGFEYKLLQYSKKNRVKSVDQQALQLKQLMNQNKSLKVKLEQLQNLQERKEKWLENNLQSAKQLQKKVQDQQGKLPKIQLRRSVQKQRTLTSLPKLQSQKKIYTKWLQSATATNVKKNSVIQKQLQQLQKLNKTTESKISATAHQIKEIQTQIQKLRAKVQQQQDQDNNNLKQQNKSNSKSVKINSVQKSQGLKSEKQKSISKGASISQDSHSAKQKKKHIGTMVTKKVRKLRKDWVGKFDGLRFSDNRYIREECRLYKVLFNTNGYCQFFYYSHKDNKKKFNSKLPFQASSLASNGKDSTFTVQFPDFIKNIRLKINLKSHRITQLSLVSNLGIQAEFVVDTNLHHLTTTSKNTQKVSSVSKEQQPQVNYQMDIKANQAITCIFGSYGTKLDEKKQITHIWLQGLGAQIIEDFVEQLI